MREKTALVAASISPRRRGWAARLPDSRGAPPFVRVAGPPPLADLRPLALVRALLERAAAPRLLPLSAITGSIPRMARPHAARAAGPMGGQLPGSPSGRATLCGSPGGR